jgi:hypothetical protein
MTNEGSRIERERKRERKTKKRIRIVILQEHSCYILKFEYELDYLIL